MLVTVRGKACAWERAASPRERCCVCCGMPTVVAKEPPRDPPDTQFAPGCSAHGLGLVDPRTRSCAAMNQRVSSSCTHGVLTDADVSRSRCARLAAEKALFTPPKGSRSAGDGAKATGGGRRLGVERGWIEHVGDDLLLLGREAGLVRRPIVLVGPLEVGKRLGDGALDRLRLLEESGEELEHLPHQEGRGRRVRRAGGGVSGRRDRMGGIPAASALSGMTCGVGVAPPASAHAQGVWLRTSGSQPGTSYGASITSDETASTLCKEGIRSETAGVGPITSGDNEGMGAGLRRMRGFDAPAGRALRGARRGGARPLHDHYMTVT